MVIIGVAMNPVSNCLLAASRNSPMMIYCKLNGIFKWDAEVESSFARAAVAICAVKMPVRFNEVNTKQLCNWEKAHVGIAMKRK